MRLDEATCGSVAFVGSTLAPFYLNDPRTGEAGPSFAAMLSLDVDEAAGEWPFAAEGEARGGLSCMVEGLAACALGDDGSFLADDELVWEYRRLFVGPAAKPAPPWGSVYTDRECVIFGEATLRLRAWMREHGVARNVDEKDPEDHVGLMLALMSWLALRQPQDLPEYLELHFFTWSSHFLEELSQVAEHPFYRGLADLTKASLEGIQQALGLSVRHPRYYR